MSAQLPDPRLTRIYRLEATLGQPLDLGETAQGHRRIVPLTGGTSPGPSSTGGCSRAPAPTGRSSCRDGTALGDIRYTLQTDGGDLLYVQSRGVRHGSAEVLARLGARRGRRRQRVHLPHLDRRSRPPPPSSTG